MKRLALLLFPLALAGCATTSGPGSVAGGECKVFQRPAYAIRGATQHDQDWIDPTIESGVGACRWARPAPRPAEWDAPAPAPAKVAKRPVKKADPKVDKKRGWLWKAIPTLAKKPRPAPVAPVAPVVESEPPAPAPPPPPPRSAIDILLHPESR
ncbi:hypothetical protein ACRAVF_18895 [Bradyrhizobium oligotrophicum S58]